MSSTTLVIGGTGKTGRKVVQQLRALGEPVRIGSRRNSPPFDWENPATWPAALAGIDRLYVSFQPDLAVPGAAKAISDLTYLAVAGGVRKVVLLSGKGEQEAERCERIVADSGIPYTILRASWFSQNFSESFLMEPILSGTVALPKPEAPIPYVDTGDIAEVAVQSLLDDRHDGRIYELTGPRQLTFPEVVEEIAAATRRYIRYVPVPLEEYVEGLRNHDLPPDYVWLIGYLFGEVLGKPGNEDVSGDIERVLGRPARDFSDYVRETADSGIWNRVPSSS
ncbi:uncharacterized protein YbjT (DUF2867 family) [Neolewinella xylanilytica]|uniref:Uncharacterized protein YbjT (DUF2867 family) n=1 Tax=Neolewinella xylanilytica TaxID=1514080 RepID=A0A2S6I6F5_9BACT|nr:NmrA family NAD(P)-binding protein [Neolewinella xylanilytica]PPK87087.1 uncharacterized protein YbjT (DUF2867 family) [Neolewinella xylanilytica]